MRELAIGLDPDTKEPLYEQIYSYIKHDIQKGQLRAGERLPSSRSLSASLEVSRSTVELAYEQLVSEGYLEAVPCRGYYVCRIEGLYSLDAGKEPVREKRPAGTSAWDFDLTPNGIDLESFPFDVWRRLTRNVLLDDSRELFQLGDPKGEWELRETISRYLHQARGVNCSPEQIVVGAGSDYLLMLLAAIMGQGHRVALENPTYRQAYRLFRNLSYEVCTVDADDKGMQMDELDRTGADIAFVMPSHQYPLGIVMPLRRRMELLKWANEENNRYIIEDDYFGHCSSTSHYLPLFYYMEGKNCIYLTSFSKTIPYLRIGVAIVHQDFQDTFNQMTQHSYYYSYQLPSLISQATLESYIKSSLYDKQTQQLQNHLKKNYQVIKKITQSWDFQLLKVISSYSGYYFTIQFLVPINLDILQQKLRENHIEIARNERCFYDPSHFQNSIRLSLARIDHQDLKKALELFYQTFLDCL